MEPEESTSRSIQNDVFQTVSNVRFCIPQFSSQKHIHEYSFANVTPSVTSIGFQLYCIHLCLLDSRYTLKNTVNDASAPHLSRK